MVSFNDLSVRDGQQSLLATRMRTEDVLRIVEALDEAGFYALEVWGGAVFDSMIRFLREDPWERLLLLKETVSRSKLMMLLRGMNLVGYRHYPEDVVAKFIEYAYRDGIDVFRVFDALNDPRNLEFPVKKIREAGAELQVCIAYTVSPIHTLEYYRDLAEDFLSSFEPEYITVKDMSGILHPYFAWELVRMLKSLGAKVNVHSHTTAGYSPLNLLKAIEAGADLVDTAISSMSYYTSHPPAESLAMALKNTPYDPGLNMEALYKAAQIAWDARSKYREYDIAFKKPPVDIGVLKHQVPGGMMSNLLSQLRELGMTDRLQEVLEEITRVREDLGWPPLVTPMSQIVGAQAVLNVAMGRYKALVKELVAYLKGIYGRPPGKIREYLLEMAEREEVSVEETLTLNEAAKRLPKNLVSKPEDYITYALFPEHALEFLKRRQSLV